jgi:glycosyltransferase involved in cell wall biosynthesis
MFCGFGVVGWSADWLRMKILHVINGLSVNRGGPPAALAALALAQANRGDDVVVFSSFRSPPPVTLSPGLHPRILVCEAPTDIDSKWYHRCVLTELRKLVRDRQIVHIHGTWRYHLPAAAKAASELGIPYIIRPAGNLGTALRQHKWYMKWPYFKLIERRIFQHAAAIHCTSAMEAEELAGLGLNARKFVVPNAVHVGSLREVEYEAVIREICPQIKTEHHVILNVGRITWKKRLNLLVEAFARLHREFPQWRLILAGTHEDPQLVRQLQVEAAKHGVGELVSLPGAVGGREKSALYSRAEMFVLPSLHENFGVSVAEALQFGIPCVVSHGVALSADVVEQGAGLACASESEALTKTMRQLLADDELRKKCSRRAVNLARRYDPETVAAQLDREYQTCIASVGSRLPVNRLSTT